MLADVNQLPQHQQHAPPTARNLKRRRTQNSSADRSTHIRVPLRLGSFDPEDERSMEAASLDGRLIELYQAARDNAPHCGGVPLSWMTIQQAAQTLRIHKSVLSNWATRGYIATVKGPGTNQHRLVHLDNILVFMQECILRDADELEDL